jgi:hypothetical protein
MCVQKHPSSAPRLHFYPHALLISLTKIIQSQIYCAWRVLCVRFKVFADDGRCANADHKIWSILFTRFTSAASKKMHPKQAKALFFALVRVHLFLSLCAGVYIVYVWWHSIKNCIKSGALWATVNQRHACIFYGCMIIGALFIAWFTIRQSRQQSA